MTTLHLDTIDGTIGLDLDRDTAADILRGIADAYDFLIVYSRRPAISRHLPHPGPTTIYLTPDDLRLLATDDQGHTHAWRLTIDHAETVRHACIAAGAVWPAWITVDRDQLTATLTSRPAA